jgi:DNA-binding SARP family transcriptional activator
MAKQPLVLRLLGRPQIIKENNDITAEIGAKASAVLTFLALEPSSSREKLAGTFWADKREQAARYRLRHTLWELRKSVGSEFIRSDDADSLLDLDAVSVDVLEFRRGYQSLGIGTPKFTPQPDQVSFLSELADLYRGDLLQNMVVQEAPLFDEWLLVERERLQLAYQEVLWALAQAQQIINDFAGAARTLNRLIQADPLRERSYRALMGVHYRAGDRAAAVQVYKQCTTVLNNELGILPSPETELVYKTCMRNTKDSAALKLDHAIELMQQKQYAEAWNVCAAVEALASDAMTLSQVVLVRAEIALSEGKASESLTLLRTARTTLTNLFTR